MTQSPVLLDVDGRGVATVTLNRPEVNNAYNGEMVHGLVDALGTCGADHAVRVVVLRGNGRHFQAGADLKWIREVGARDEAYNVDVSRRTAAAVRDLNEFEKPTVALVHGGCFGGGIGIISACDVVVASSDALFAITEARWGLMAGIIVPQLNAAMGEGNVRRYALTCERFGAERAFELGLVHEVCATGGLDEAAAPVIDGLLLSAPGAIAVTKRRILAEAGSCIPDEHLEVLVREHAEKRLSAEAAEGLASFLEKRKPAWYPQG